MTEDIILRIIIGATVTMIFGLNAKIIWDWLNKGNKDKEAISVTKEDITKIKTQIENIKEKIDTMSKIINGCGDVEKSIAFRLASIEQHMTDCKRFKEARGL